MAGIGRIGGDSSSGGGVAGLFDASGRANPGASQESRPEKIDERSADEEP